MVPKATMLPVEKKSADFTGNYKGKDPVDYISGTEVDSIPTTKGKIAVMLLCQ